MEYHLDYDIIGEIMIPLENNFIENQQTDGPSSPSKNQIPLSNHLSIKLESILEKNYKDFRSILFQGELLRFFVVLRIDKSDDLNTEELIKSLYIKFEFDSSCIDSSCNTNTGITIDEFEASQVMAENDNLSDFFSLQRNSLFNKFSTSENSKQSYNYKNKNYDFISRKVFLENKNILILEVIRHITVPNKFLNKNLIMKLNLMKKNENSYINNYSTEEIFYGGMYEDIKEFTILKTLFKEVKIIRPLNISKVRQIDILPDTSLLQINLENITSSINFIDRNLRLSRFLKNQKEVAEDEGVINNGINLTIQEMQVLKEETVIDNKNSKNLENYIKNSDLTNIHFTLLNSEIPIEIRPGEEVVLALKINKSAFIYEKTNTGNNPTNAEPILMDEFYSQNQNQSYFSYKEDNSSVYNVVTQSNSQRNYFSFVESAKSNKSLQKSFLQRSSGNILATQSNSYLPTVVHKYSFLNFNNAILAGNNLENRKGSIQNEKIDEENIYSETDEIIKVKLSTPLLLNITSFKFYDSLFMSVPIKWSNEITRFLKVEINIPEEIKLHEYFTVSLIVKNISNLAMDLSIEISDSTHDFNKNQKENTNETLDFKGAG